MDWKSDLRRQVYDAFFNLKEPTYFCLNLETLEFFTSSHCEGFAHYVECLYVDDDFSPDLIDEAFRIEYVMYHGVSWHLPQSLL